MIKIDKETIQSSIISIIILNGCTKSRNLINQAMKASESPTCIYCIYAIIPTDVLLHWLRTWILDEGLYM